MKLHSLSLTSILLCSVLLTGCSGKKPIVGEHISPQGTTNFSPTTNKFAVYLPAVPTEKLSYEKTEAGPLETTTYQCETAKVTYIVVAIKMPPEADMTTDSEKSLNEIQSSFFESSKGTLDWQRSLNLDGTAGREFAMSTPDGFQSRLMVYVTPGHCYQIMSVGLKADLQAEKAENDKIVNSFRLLP